MRKLLITLLLLTLSGCGLFKTTTKHSEKQRTRTKIHSTEQVIEKGVRIERIEPDSVTFNNRQIVPDKDSVYRRHSPNLDLIIKTKKGITKQTVCKQKPQFKINLYQRKENKTADTKIKDNKKETDYKSKGATFKPVYIVYVFAGLGFLIVVNNLTKKNN